MMAVSLALVTAGPPRIERRSVGRGRARGRLQLVVRPVSLWCVSCFVCSALGPAATTQLRGTHPPKNSGFVYRTIGEISGWICGECDAKYRMMLPPPTRGDCIDGPRPCRAALCKYNMLFDVSRKAKDDFQIKETCALDIADQGEHTLKAIGELWGMTREGSRYIILNALEKVRGIHGLEFDFDDELSDGEDES